MNVLQMVGKCHLLHRDHSEINPTLASALILISGQLPNIKSQADIQNSILLGLKLIKWGIVDQTELQFAISNIQDIEQGMGKVARKYFAELN